MKNPLGSMKFLFLIVIDFLIVENLIKIIFYIIFFVIFLLVCRTKDGDECIFPFRNNIKEGTPKLFQG